MICATPGPAPVAGRATRRVSLAMEMVVGVALVILSALIIAGIVQQVGANAPRS